MENWFGVSGRALQLLSSYLIGRTQSVGIYGHRSSSESLLTGVSQGSVLGEDDESIFKKDDRSVGYERIQEITYVTR